MTVRIASYQIPFSVPLQYGTSRLLQREGLLVYLSDARHTGVGEVAPLITHSIDRLDKIRSTLINIRNQLDVLTEIDPSPDAFEWIKGLTEDLPALRCGLEAAWLDLMAARGGIRVGQKLSPQVRNDSLVNGLIPISAKYKKTLRKQVQQGITTFKIKASPNFDQMFAKMDEICDIGSRVRFRIDANQSWTYKQARSLFRRLSEYPVEYIEEPLRQADPATLQALYSEFGLCIALDESVQKTDHLASHLAQKSAAVYMVRPMTAGGWTGVQQRIRDIHSSGGIPVLSHLMESQVGRRFCWEIVTAIQPELGAAGLLTGGLLKESKDECIVSGRLKWT